MVPARHPRLLGFALLTMSMVGWGVTFAMNRWMLESTPISDEPWPGLTLSALRFALVAIVLVPWATVLLWRRWPLSLRRWAELVVLGILSIVAYHLLANSAQTYASSGLNAVLHQMTPVVAFIGGLLALKERITAMKLAGLAMATAGAIWYSLSEAGAALVGDNIPLAAALIFMVALVWTFYMVFAKRALAFWSGVDLAVIVTAIGAVLMVLVSVALSGTRVTVDWGIFSDFGRPAWLIMIYLSLVAGVACYLMYNEGLKRVEGSQAAVFGYLLVPVALVTGLFLPGELREIVTPAKLMAAVMIIAGVYLVTWQRRS